MAKEFLLELRPEETVQHKTELKRVKSLAETGFFTDRVVDQARLQGQKIELDGKTPVIVFGGEGIA